MVTLRGFPSPPAMVRGERRGRARSARGGRGGLSVPKSPQRELAGSPRVLPAAVATSATAAVAIAASTTAAKSATAATGRAFAGFAHADGASLDLPPA